MLLGSEGVRGSMTNLSGEMRISVAAVSGSVVSGQKIIEVNKRVNYSLTLNLNSVPVSHTKRKHTTKKSSRPQKPGD